MITTIESMVWMRECCRRVWLRGKGQWIRVVCGLRVSFCEGERDNGLWWDLGVRYRLCKGEREVRVFDDVYARAYGSVETRLCIM